MIVMNSVRAPARVRLCETRPVFFLFRAGAMAVAVRRTAVMTMDSMRAPSQGGQCEARPVFFLRGAGVVSAAVRRAAMMIMDVEAQVEGMR